MMPAEVTYAVQFVALAIPMGVALAMVALILARVWARP